MSACEPEAELPSGFSCHWCLFIVMAKCDLILQVLQTQQCEARLAWPQLSEEHPRCCSVVLSAMPRFFSFCYSSNAFQLSTLENKVIGGAVFEIRNKMKSLTMYNSCWFFLLFLSSFFSSLSLFLPSFNILIFFFFSMFLRIEWRKENRVKTIKNWISL